MKLTTIQIQIITQLNNRCLWPRGPIVPLGTWAPPQVGVWGGAVPPLPPAEDLGGSTEGAMLLRCWALWRPTTMIMLISSHRLLILHVYVHTADSVFIIIIIILLLLSSWYKLLLLLLFNKYIKMITYGYTDYIIQNNKNNNLYFNIHTWVKPSYYNTHVIPLHKPKNCRQSYEHVAMTDMLWLFCFGYQGYAISTLLYSYMCLPRMLQPVLCMCNLYCS